MRPFVVAAVVLLCCTSQLHAQGLGNQPAAVKASAARPASETIVYPVRSGAVSELAESLRILYSSSQIIFQAQNNVLLIRTDPDLKEEILGALTQLDRPQQTIAVWVYLLRSHGRPLSPDETAGFTGPRDEVLKRIEALRASDQLAIENRIELTTIENQSAMVQCGQQLPVVVGTTVTGSRGRSNSYQHVQTGTLLSVTARTTPDAGIVMEINFEKSQIEPQAAPSDDEANPPRSGISTLTQKSTVQFADGEAALAGTMIGKPAAGSDHAYLVVSANVRRGAAKRPTAASVPFSRPTPPSTSRPPRATRPTGSALGSGTRMTVERFEATVRSNFDRVDRDGNGVLSDQELSTGGAAALRDDFKKYDQVSFAVYRQVLASRFGIALPKEARQEPQPDRGGNSGLASRYLDFARKTVGKYDSDGDGKLNAEERAKMAANPSAADVDDDGFITAEELADYFQKR